MIRILIIAGAVLLTTSLLGAAMAGAYFLRFYAPVPAPDYPEPADALEARLQDIDALSRLVEIDRSFSPEERSAFLEHIDAMKAGAGEASDAAFLMDVARAAAITENGHTNVSFGALVDRLNSLPVRFYWFGDGLHVVRARAAHAGLIGARVLAYDGRAPAVIVDALDPYIGGAPAWARYRSPLFFGSPAALHAIGQADNPDEVALTLQLPGGSVETISLQVEDEPTLSMQVKNHLLPAVSSWEARSGHDWRFVQAPLTAQSYYHRNPERRLWREALPGGGVYIRMRAIADDEEIGIGEFQRAIQADYRRDPATFLALDLRSNYGGDLTRTMGFARTIADLVAPNGRIYVLTDGGTFSAALVTAAFAVHSGGDRSAIVGSPMGDHEQFWAEGGGRVRLPNTGLGVSIATGYHDWENGCKDLRRCYWLSVWKDVPAGSLAPDMRAPLLYSDFAAGGDTAMQAVFAAEAAAPPIQTSG